MTTPPPIQLQPRPIWPGTLCANCAYDLGGLLSDANCPECNTPIARSLQPDLIQVAPIEYLRTIRNAIRLIIGCLFSFLILLVITFAAVMVALFFTAQQQSTPGTSHPWSQPLGVVIQASTMLKLITSLLLLYALWLFTTPNSVWQQSGLDPSSRRTLRIVSIIYLLTQLTTALPTILNPTGFLSRMSNTGINTSGVASTILYASSFIALILALIFLPIYAKALATRLREPGLASFAGVLAWLLPVLCTIGMCVFYLGPLVSYILIIILFFRLHNPFNAIIKSREHADSSMSPGLA